MSTNDFERLANEVMSDQNYQNVNMKGVDLWLLLCACQGMQTLRGVHEPLRNAYRDLGKRLQAIVVAIHPNVRPLADAGWDRAYDVPYYDDDDDDDDDDIGSSIFAG